jgi:hypothetical protein
MIYAISNFDMLAVLAWYAAWHRVYIIEHANNRVTGKSKNHPKFI